MTEKNLWLDEVDWKMWSEGEWIKVSVLPKEKIEYLTKRLEETEKITQNYFLLEEAVLDFIKSRPTDKAVIRFRQVLENLYDTP